MRIIINNRQKKMPVTKEMKEAISRVLQKSAEVYGIGPAAEVSLTLADNAYLQKLNYEYRGKDQPTDVLSFALNDETPDEDVPEILDTPEDLEVLLGDIVISLERTASQAEEYGHSFLRELSFLTIHGMLHLLGYDHLEESDRLEMRQEEEYILEKLGYGRGALGEENFL